MSDGINYRLGILSGRLKAYEREEDLVNLFKKMISKDEIDKKAQEFEIHSSNVQRDYIFGWLLNGFFYSKRIKRPDIS